ncbi:MAG: beta-ketoacyl-ACP synthase III [Nitrospirota bacterium]
MFSQILGTGASLPNRIVTNKEISERIDLSEQEIEKKTGILTRHWVEKGETTSTLAIAAAKSACQSAGIAPDQIDLIVVSTSSPDMTFPSVACLVQKEMGARAIPAFDINASCSGFLVALAIADQYIQSGRAQNALIIASEVKSAYLNQNDHQTVSLFGDGAGAVVLSGSGSGGGLLKIKAIKIGAGGPARQLITLPAGGSRQPLSKESLEQDQHYMKMEGSRLFRLAVTKMGEVVVSLLKDNHLSMAEIDLFLFHQANLRILEAVLKKQGIASEKHHTVIQKYGNTSSASLPILLHDARTSGRIKPGARLALFAFGGGYTWGYALIEG